MFLAVVKLLHPQQQQQQLVSPVVTMVESMREEVITKHLHDGRIIQTEHRYFFFWANVSYNALIAFDILLIFSSFFFFFFLAGYLP